MFGILVDSGHSEEILGGGGGGEISGPLPF